MKPSYGSSSSWTKFPCKLIEKGTNKQKFYIQRQFWRLVNIREPEHILSVNRQSLCSVLDAKRRGNCWPRISTNKGILHLRSEMPNRHAISGCYFPFPNYIVAHMLLLFPDFDDLAVQNRGWAQWTNQITTGNAESETWFARWWSCHC